MRVHTNYSRNSYHQYTVEELNKMGLVNRIKLTNWRLEVITLSTILVFCFLFKIGDLYNQRKVKAYLNGLSDLFTNNFYQFGVAPDKLYVKDSAESYSSYATGRVNIAKVNLEFRLKPRHNLFVLVLETIMSFFTSNVQAPSDRVDIIITPSSDAEYDNFISAIVSKIGMNEFRKFNYFLSLTKTSDSASLPQSFVFMSESSEIQDKLLSPEIKDALTMESASWLKYVAFTDQSVERPSTLLEYSPRRRIIIATDVASSSVQIKQISDVLSGVFNLVDKLAAKEITFKSETLRKVVKTRENELAKWKRIEDEIKQEKLAEEKAKLKREERLRNRELSDAEQLKLEKKAAEKRQRKAAKKQKVRM